MDEAILESVRRIIYKWVHNYASLTANAAPGDTTIHVPASIRFKPGEEVSLYNPNIQKGESYLYVDSVPDRTSVKLTTPVLGANNGGYGPSQNSMLVKSFGGRFVQGIYIGDPEVIPLYPAITIMGDDKESDWQALGLTREDYKITINTYVQADNTEAAYRYLLRLTKAIERGLKRNIFPLVAPGGQANVTADVAVDDLFIKVPNTELFYPDEIIILENIFRAEELRIKCIVDSTTIQVYTPVANPYLTTEESKVIGVTRFIYNSWPKSIQYGFKHKGSLLHASSIKWFAWEGEQQERGGHLDPHLS